MNQSLADALWEEQLPPTSSSASSPARSRISTVLRGRRWLRSWRGSSGASIVFAFSTRQYRQSMKLRGDRHEPSIGHEPGPVLSSWNALV